MKGKRRILAITLLVSILIGLVPTGSNHVHASDWEECSFCDHYHSDDYLCDGCGGCNENCDSDCYISNHCHSCGECFDNVLICKDCWTCENCVKICPDCHYCEDNCNSSGIEFCPSCDRCYFCYGADSCTYCNTCGECADICPQCREICSDCAEDLGLCQDCGKCQICAHDSFCESCGECSDHWDSRCSNCHYCSNCAEACSGCEDYCSECSLVCPDCGRCEDCTGDDVCQDCGRCSECGMLCSDCGNYCADCTSMCYTCQICSECADICTNCWNACSDCSDMCGGCLEYCPDCADICEECGEACEHCGNMCPDCYDVCSDCVPFCKGCDECQNCRGDFCSRCEDYCSSCADFCQDCGACDFCVDLCVNCGDYCPDCKEVCPNCEYCGDCADVCELCGEHCSNCEDWACEFCDISKSCKYHAYCDLCGMCQSDPQHLVCPDCGDHVTSHGTRKSIDENFHQTVCNCGRLFGDLEAHNIIYEVITEATETEEGLGQYYCSYRKSFGCTYHKEVTIPALGINHECVYDMWFPSWNGHKKMCTCGKTDGENIAHINETIVLEEATEDKNGLAYDKCTVCGYNVDPYVIPATNHSHNYSDKWTYDNSGHWHECTCGDRSDEAYHTMGSWVTTKYPTTTSAGSKERTCTVCDFKEIVVIPALAEQVVVTFDSQGGSLVENKTVNNGSKVDKPTDPTKEGYNFMGWYTSTDYTNEWKFASSIYESMTLYAKWEIDPGLIFEVSIENDGNGIGNANPASASAGTEISLSYTANEGYKFKEWQVISGGVSIVDNKFTMPANPVVVKAIFEKAEVIPETYTVTVQNDSNGTGSASPATASAGTEISLSYKVNEGYKFKEWQVISGGVSIVDNKFTMPANDVVVKAIFEKIEVIPETYAVIINGSYATTSGAGDYAKGTIVNINAGSRSGYNFNGWTSTDGITLANANSASTSFTMPNKPVILMANWKSTSTNSGGGSGGSGSSTTTKSEKPKESNQAPIDYIVADNIALVDLTESKVQEVIKNSQDGKVVIDLSKDDNISAASLPRFALESMKNAGLEISIQLVQGTLSMDLDALASVMNQADGKIITMGIEGKGKINLNDLQLKSIQSGDNVYDISITSGDKNITNFEGKLNMQLPYNGAQPVGTWYLNDSGEREKIESTYKDNSVYFTLSHLSLYIVGLDNQKLPFVDVKEDGWFYEAVKYVYENDLMKGTGGNQFSPNEATTRGMIVTILHRLEGLPLAKQGSFTDVKENKYYANAVAWAAENKIVNGYGNDKFGPEDPITREQLAAILMNYAKYKGYSVSARADLGKYEDSKGISNWARDAMSWANAEGLIQGDGNKLIPTGNATRAQVAAILSRFVDKIIK